MKRLICLVCLLPLLAACDDVKDTVGLGRNNPDEFTVVQNPPLAMPPDFGLRPPDRAAQGPKAEAAPTIAARAVQGDIKVEDAGSPGVEAFLTQAKANDAKDEIRGTIDKESDGVVVKDKGFVDKLMVWQDTTPPDPTINASAEEKRVTDEQAKNNGFISGDGAAFDKPKAKAPLEGVLN